MLFRSSRTGIIVRRSSTLPGLAEAGALTTTDAVALAAGAAMTPTSTARQQATAAVALREGVGTGTFRGSIDDTSILMGVRAPVPSKASPHRHLLDDSMSAIWETKRGP